MSDAQPGDTGSGFLVGVDPRTPPPTQADLQGAQVPTHLQQPSPVTIITGPNGNGGAPEGQRVYSEEEVDRYRAETNARMSAMDAELQQLREEREQREQAAQAETQRLADEARAHEEEALDVRQLLEKRDQEWRQQFETLQADRERDLAIFEQERRFNEVQTYRVNRLEQEGEYILPELRDLIVGTTEPEVDQAIEIMKQRTAAILSSVQAAVTAQRGPIRGVAPTGQPPVGPMEQQMATETLSTEDIKKMDPKTYGQYRDRLMQYASQNRFGQPQ